MSMELISREEALDCSIYAHDWNSYSDLIAELPTVKAIPIERLEQIKVDIETDLSWVMYDAYGNETEVHKVLVDIFDKAIKNDEK